MKKPYKKTDKNCHKKVEFVKIWQNIHNNSSHYDAIAF